MKILITGICGFAGTSIAKSLLQSHTNLQIVGIDNIGLVNKITTIISDNLSINMRKMSFDTEGDVFKGSITLRVKNKKIIDKLIQRIKKIKGVYKAVRD